MKSSLKKVGVSLATITLATSSLLLPVAEATGKVKLNNSTKVYISADAAKSEVNPVSTYYAGDYFVFRRFGDFVNITKRQSSPGAWVNEKYLGQAENSSVVRTENQNSNNSNSASQSAVKKENGKIELLERASIYINAEEARLGRNPRGSYSAGSYYVFREFGGSINISRVKGVPGGWISLNTIKRSPVQNAVEVEVADTSVEQNIVDRLESVNQPASGEVKSDKYELKNTVSGFLNAGDAKNGANPATTMSKGSYYVFREFNGMINISKSKGVPGAWINPNHTEKVVVKTPTNESSDEVKSESKAPVGNSSIRSGVTNMAASFLGHRYVYGGSTPSSGFDCSGFVQYIMRQHGISMNRTSASQGTQGTKISKSDLRPGDLLFFGASRITHVGIYVGDGMMIHASNPTRGVVKDSINSNYYTRNFISARRVIK